MALPDDSNPIEWVNYLGRMHDGDLQSLREYDALYQGTAPLHYIHPEVLREVEDRIQAVSLGWPMLAVDPLEERLDVLGFAYPEEDEPDPDAAPDELVSAVGDKNLQRVWQDNDLDEESQMGHLDALVMKRAYVTVGTNDSGDTDSPLVTVESPLEMFALVDPRTRKVRAALRRWTEEYDPLTQMPQTYATLYLPNMTAWFDRGPQGWRETHRDPHQLGEPLVSPLTNRTRLANRYGASELTDPLISLTHAANKVASDMMLAAERHALPLRALFGLGPDDFVKDGRRQSATQVIMGHLMAIPAEDGTKIRAHEFSASQLSNFHATLSQLAKHAAGLIGIDPSVLGMSAGDNPASADALRAREVRLVKKAERRQKAFGGGWERAMRLVQRLQEGDWDPQARRLETIWRDAATPTRAQAADAVVKLLTAKAITRRQSRQDLGYTPMQIRRMEAEDRAEAALDPLGVFGLERGQQEPVALPSGEPSTEPVA